MFRGRLLQVRVVQVGEGLSGDGLQWHDGGKLLGFEPRHHNRRDKAAALLPKTFIPLVRTNIPPLYT